VGKEKEATPGPEEGEEEEAEVVVTWEPWLRVMGRLGGQALRKERVPERGEVNWEKVRDEEGEGRTARSREGGTNTSPHSLSTGLTSGVKEYCPGLSMAQNLPSSEETVTLGPPSRDTTATLLSLEPLE
jgi:hypothetical protein